MSQSSTDFVCSVVIPVKNGEKYLEDCLISICNQDCVFDFEIIVINDHSSDRTAEIIKKYCSIYPNIRAMNSEGNGIAAALNQGILAAKSQIIIRMDADDLMIQNRIRLQLDYLARNHSCVLVGGQIKPFGNVEPLPVPNVYPSSHLEIIKMLCIGNSFAHPTVAFRKEAVIAAGLYRSNFDGAEDYELWTRLAKQGKLHNLSQILVKYRIHERQVTKEKIVNVQKRTYSTQLRWVFSSWPKSLGVPVSKEVEFKCTGMLFLFMRVARDLIWKIKNAS